MKKIFYFLASILLVFYFNIVLFNFSIEWKNRHSVEQLKCIEVLYLRVEIMIYYNK